MRAGDLDYGTATLEGAPKSFRCQTLQDTMVYIGSQQEPLHTPNNEANKLQRMSCPR